MYAKLIEILFAVYKRLFWVENSLSYTYTDREHSTEKECLQMLILDLFHLLALF